MSDRSARAEVVSPIRPGELVTIFSKEKGLVISLDQEMYARVLGADYSLRKVWWGNLTVIGRASERAFKELHLICSINGPDGVMAFLNENKDHEAHKILDALRGPTSWERLDDDLNNNLNPADAANGNHVHSDGCRCRYVQLLDDDFDERLG